MSGVLLRLVGAALIALLSLGALPTPGRAEEFATPLFRELWARTDAAVANGSATRAWVWGPEPITAGLFEPYAQGPDGTRLVQYFDKGRMELNQLAGPVTSGLLARELITGQRQIGVAAFEGRLPAELPIAGDEGADGAPTYATFGRVLGRAPLAENAPLTEVIGRDGSIAADLALSRYNARAAVLIPETNHRLASPFRDYFEGRPLPNTEGESSPAAPFSPWYSVTGLPISEGYWARLRVAGIERDVLIQAFERRVLTYTPENPPDSRVEMGNVGRAYLGWLASPPPVVEAGLPCPPIPEVPVADRRRDGQYTVLGSALHRAGERLHISGDIRNDGDSSVATEVSARLFDADGASLGRFTGFTDRDFWVFGQIAAFRIDLPLGLNPAGWEISVRRPDDRPTGGLASGFTLENLRGRVDGLGIGEVRGVLRYSGTSTFTDLAVVRVHALDGCGSLVTSAFTRVGRGAIQPGETIEFSLLLLNAEGARSLRAIVEARTGRAALVPADTLQVFSGELYPTPIVPITAVGGCCAYTRAYSRPDGVGVRSDYRRTPPSEPATAGR